MWTEIQGFHVLAVSHNIKHSVYISLAICDFELFDICATRVWLHLFIPGWAATGNICHFLDNICI